MGIDVFGDPQMPAGWTTDIAIYNNTQYYPTTVGSNVYFVRQIGTTGNVTLANNILWTNSSSSDSALYVSWDSLGTVTNNGHGLIYSPRQSTFSAPFVGTGGLTNQDPKFVTNGSDFHLQSSSPARNAGLTTAFVYSDPSDVMRPKESVWDIGRYEYKP